MAYTQVLVIRSDLKLGKGKLAAQCAHASLQAFLKSQERKYGSAWQEWLDEGAQKIVVKVSSEEELLHLFEQVKNHFPSALIADAGHTQVTPGTKTCIGIGPARESDVDKYTGHLKLL
ncbi:MAG: peptidyl-tRNA hydrolase Pth2 [Candidatus Diapherotrites archaeon]|nr:peptidyl-tRNA hydrolase Pth2 [Candidatus Diapherotrites archaeon]MDZ4256685.1 peptidyl-tRNA hydrolase Pth2 [archaeon]